MLKRSHCLEDVNKLLIPKVKQEISVDAFFSPGDDCRNAILSQIAHARSTIDVCVFTVSDNIIVEKLIDAWEKGIKVRIVTDNDKQYDRGSDIFRMKEKGIPIRTDSTPTICTISMQSSINKFYSLEAITGHAVLL